MGLVLASLQDQAAKEDKKGTPVHKLRKPRASLASMLEEGMRRCGNIAVIVFGRSDNTQEDERQRKDGPKEEDKEREKKRRRKHRPSKGKKDKEERASVEEEAADENQYLSRRKFRFLHYYAGKEDPLGKALKEEAEANQMILEVTSCEKEGENGVDLEEEPYIDHCKSAASGKWDGFHSGFPCTTFSRLRWRTHQNYPGPCRSKDHPYGLPSNTEALQTECDEGTLHAARTGYMAKLILDGREREVLKPVVTFENPPPSQVEGHLSAWELKEIEEVVSRYNFATANFTSCKYQMEFPRGERFYKPQRFSGTLLGMTGLSGDCPCGAGAVHIPVIGKEASTASGKYPDALCKAYAVLTIEHFKKMAKAEFVGKKEKTMERELDKLRRIKKEKEERAGTAEQAFKDNLMQGSSTLLREQRPTEA